MKAEHTQGEWSKSNPAIGNKRLFTIHAGKLLIAKTCDHLDKFNNSLIEPTQAEANAKLIASAPELLEALKLLLQAQYTYYHDLDDTEDEKVTQGIKDRAEQAIKKATE